MAAAGVTRVSMGAQTFAPHVQELINRIQPFEMVADAVAHFRRAGIARINFDLMYGLPGQTLDDVRDTIVQALTLAPDRVAVFGYAHMPRMMPRQRMIADDDLPDAAARFAMSALAHDLFVAAGYVSIGFDHFARADDPMAQAAASSTLRRNFQGYTTDPGDAMIGMGTTAISQFDGLIVQNDKHVGAWRDKVIAGALAGDRGVARNDDDRLRGSVIERLLCDGAVDVAAIAEARGMVRETLAPALVALQDYVARGLVEVDGWQVRVQDRGWPYARLIAAAFDTHFNAAAGRHGAAV
jgi:oxygen-independent coproporphyrinogen-3 oxidase